MLNADGTKFELTDNPTYQSFRCCFLPTYGATYKLSALTIKEEATTAIQTIQSSAPDTADACYNISGQRVSPHFKGIVIHNGKKVVKK